MLNSHTKLLGIIGHPVAHSLSPIIHNVALQKISANFVYLAFDVIHPLDALSAMKALGIRGFSVTIPHKVSIIDYLDEVDSSVSLAGACNTIVNDNGKLIGYNTDAEGAVMPIKSKIKNKEIALDKENICLIGYGGAARAIASQLIQDIPFNSLYIIGRNEEKMQNFQTFLKDKHPNKDVQWARYPSPQSVDMLKTSALIINTTPVGMEPTTDESPIDSIHIASHQIVYDIIYKPLLTKLLKDAGKKGALILDGLEMLINQAARQFQLFTGQNPDTDLMRKAAMDYLE
jgi:shikimate dehydrogenase